MKITITQKGRNDHEVVFSQTFERDTEKEILDIIKQFSDLARDYEATYLTYEIED